MTHKKESAGGYDTTTAEIKHAGKIIASYIRSKAALIRIGALLATFFRGLA
jgi:hypothetical protein